MGKIDSSLNRSEGQRRHKPEQNLDAFKVSATSSIAKLLAQLLREKLYVRAFLPGGTEFAMGRIREQTEKYFDIEFLNDEARECRIDAGDRIDMVSRLDGIKVQFQVQRRETAQYSGATVLRCALPEVAYRLQRRDAFRVYPTPGTRLELVLRRESNREFAYEILNLSATGVGFALAADVPPVQIEQIFEHSRLELGTRVPIPCSLLVRSVSLIENRSEGYPVGRVGAQFINLPAPVQRRLQTYVQDLERAAIRAARA
jgi:c-di-GMP-binding flagellar brake protein YcgR